MMRAVGVFLAGLLLASGASAQMAGASAEAMIFRIHEAAKTAVFSGTYVHAHDSHLHASRIYQIREGKSAITKIQAVEGRPQEIIRTESGTRIYFPQRQVVKFDQTPSVRTGFPSVFVGDPAGVMRHYDVSFGGIVRIADVDALEVNLRPRDDLRWPVRLWVDKKTNLVMKCQTLDFQGKVIEQVAFSDFSATPREASFVTSPTYAGAKDWPVRDASMQSVRPMPALKYKADTLKGFDLVGVYQRPSATPEMPFSLRRYVFTDGLATVSVFVQTRLAEGPLNAEVHRHGATSMLARKIQDAWVTVMGEVPPETLRQFALSLEWKTSP